MKISHAESPIRHQSKLSRYKDFHEIQIENHEEFNLEIKKAIVDHQLKAHQGKLQEETNLEKKELFHPPYYKALMLKKLNTF